jgi:hypothetical protein
MTELRADSGMAAMCLIIAREDVRAGSPPAGWTG